MIKRDYPFLLKIQQFLNCGSIYYRPPKDCYTFFVIIILIIILQSFLLLKIFTILLSHILYLDFLDFQKAFFIYKNPLDPRKSA